MPIEEVRPPSLEKSNNTHGSKTCLVACPLTPDRAAGTAPARSCAEVATDHCCCSSCWPPPTLLSRPPSADLPAASILELRSAPSRPSLPACCRAGSGGGAVRGPVTGASLAGRDAYAAGGDGTLQGRAPAASCSSPPAPCRTQQRPPSRRAAGPGRPPPAPCPARGWNAMLVNRAAAAAAGPRVAAAQQQQLAAAASHPPRRSR